MSATLLRRHLAAAAAGTSLGAAYYYFAPRQEQPAQHDAASSDAQAPRLPPGCPPHLVTDAALAAAPSSSSQAAEMDDLSRLDGHWLAYYSGPCVLRLTGTPTGVRARHLTGSSFGLPAGAEAFDVTAPGWRGSHFGSALPNNLWPNAAPCRLNLYHQDHSRRALDFDSLSLDVYVGARLLSWLAPVRVPLKRIPTDAVRPDADGFMRVGGAGLAAAEKAVAQRCFEEALVDGG